jgi:DNA-directed RNA polymerase subunit beta'
MAEDLKTGGAAIQHLLSKIDTNSRIGEIEGELKTARGTNRTKLNRELGYLKALKESGDTADKAYIINKVPVLPPSMRPVYTNEKGQLVVSDVNELYQGMGAVNEQLTSLKDLPDSEKKALRTDLYDGLKAIQGLGDPISHKQSLKGIFRQIAGTNSPKGGYFQHRLTRRRQNVSGRSTITLGEDLDIDQVGLPEEMAWTLFRDFTVKELVSNGHTKADALEQIKDRTSTAEKALQHAMNQRPVWLNRSPSLHRHSIMAFNPVLTPGRDIKINPLVVKGFNADFDGDSMSVHVPVTREAVDEAKVRKPTDILFSAGTEKLMIVPGQASALGLYLMSNTDGEVVGEFKNEKEALAASRANTIRDEDTILVNGKKTTAGRIKIDEQIPEGFREYGTLNKKNLGKMLSDIAVSRPKDYGGIVGKLRKMGDEYATNRGFSIGLDDLDPLTGMRDQMLSDADKKIQKGSIGKTEKEKDALFSEVYGEVASKMEDEIGKTLANSDNSVGHMLISGSRGSAAQARQIFAAPLLAQDASGRPIPIPIKNSYMEGLDTQEYFAAGYGARAGAVGRSHQTALPGALAKEVLASVVDSVVTEHESEDMPSLKMSTKRQDDDLVDRFLAADVSGKGGRKVAKKGDLLTSAKLSRLREEGVSDVDVYTPLNAELPGGGIPAKAFGLDENGKIPDIGTNLGLLSGHAMTEPISQMTLDAFHSGATGGTKGRVSKFDRIQQLFQLPKALPGKATLAKKDGRIGAVRDSPAGGWDVEIGGDTHYVPKGNPLKIKEGDAVRAGEAISDGPIQPHELLEIKGLPAVQEYLTDEIQKETGVKRRWVETVVGAMTSMSEVDDPGDSEFYPGDSVPNWAIRKHNKDPQTTNIQAKPIFKGVNMLPLVKAGDNWLAGMDFRRLKDVISEGALNNKWSELSSVNPIPAVAYGADFGLGEKGRY